METDVFIASQMIGKWTVFYNDHNGETDFLYFARRIDALQKARELVRMGIATTLIVEPNGALMNRWGGYNIYRMC